MKIKLAILTLAATAFATAAQAGPQFGFYVTTGNNGNQCGRPVYYQRPAYICTPVYQAPRYVPVYYGNPYGYNNRRRDCDTVRVPQPVRRYYSEKPKRWRGCDDD
jgi:hypothetical protein